ncbi:MAG: hypothetical protein LBH08_04095 [Puniceicoccales bacterium]|nr:hypothetical protein [Puniceicoccales bacterium]
MDMYVYNVGQANCILVIVGDAEGKSAIFFDTGIQRIDQFKEDSPVRGHLVRTLAAQVTEVVFVLSHTDRDHINIFFHICHICQITGKSIAAVYVGMDANVDSSSVNSDPFDIGRVIDKLKFNPRTTIVPIINGISDPFSISMGGAKIEFLMPGEGYTIAKTNPNEASLVTRLVYQDKSILFTGDAPGKLFRAIAGLLQFPDILVCPHHGSMSEGSYLWRGELNHPRMISIISSNPTGCDHLPERSFMNTNTLVGGLHFAPHVIAYHSKLRGGICCKQTSAPIFVTGCSGIPLACGIDAIRESIDAIRESIANNAGIGYHINMSSGNITIRAIGANGEEEILASDTALDSEEIVLEVAATTTEEEDAEE